MCVVYYGWEFMMSLSIVMFACVIRFNDYHASMSTCSKSYDDDCSHIERMIGRFLCSFHSDVCFG